MRADVNLSIREAGAAEFGTRTEMKNLNSFKAIARAIEGERERQIDLLTIFDYISDGVSRRKHRRSQMPTVDALYQLRQFVHETPFVRTQTPFHIQFVADRPNKNTAVIAVSLRQIAALFAHSATEILVAIRFGIFRQSDTRHNIHTAAFGGIHTPFHSDGIAVVRTEYVRPAFRSFNGVSVTGSTFQPYLLAVDAYYGTSLRRLSDAHLSPNADARRNGNNQYPASHIRQFTLLRQRTDNAEVCACLALAPAETTLLLAAVVPHH